MTVRLDEAVEAIVDAIVEAVTGEAVAGGDVDAVSVVRGDRARPMPELPAVWVVPDQAVHNGTTYGDEEQWDLGVALAGMVSADDPEEGGRAAARLAARARSAVLVDRTLGLEYVIDVKSTLFDSSSRSSERNRNIHWADATIQVTFSVTG